MAFDVMIVRVDLCFFPVMGLGGLSVVCCWVDLMEDFATSDGSYSYIKQILAEYIRDEKSWERANKSS